jgi:pilus assembly protein CpaB
MRRRIFGLFAALVLAVAGTLLLVLYVDSAKDDAVAGVQMTNVLVVRKPIPKGSAPTIDQVRVQKVPAQARAEHAIVDLASIKELVATTMLLPGEQLVIERFAARAVVSRGDVPPGLLEVTLPVTRDRAVGGEIRPGGKVALLVTFPAVTTSDGRSLPEETHVLMHKVLVTAVQTDAALPPAAKDAKEAGNEPAQATQAPKGAFLVTFALDAASAERVVFAQETGSLWLAVEPDDAPEAGTKHVTRENVF